VIGLAGTAWGADLQLSLVTSMEYDSNVRRRERDIKDDFVFRAAPRLDLIEDEGKFTYNLWYTFPYQKSIKEDVLDDFNHIANARADYHLSDATQFSFRNRFSYLETLTNRVDDDVVNDPNLAPQISDNEEKERVLRNRLDLGMEHMFSPRLSSNYNFDFDLYDTTQDNRSNNRQYSLRGGAQYALTRRHQLGGGVAVSYQDFDETDAKSCAQFNAASESIFVGPFLSWVFSYDETTSLEAALGPSYVYSNRDGTSCLDANGVPDPQPGDSDHDITFFGTAALNKRWTPTLDSTVSYRRRQDTASGLGGSAVLDAVALLNSWQITELWSFNIRADWTKRKAATGLQTNFQNDLNTERWSAGSVLSRRLTRNLTASARYRYTKQSSKGGTRGRFSDFDAHLVTLGVQYSLDPFEVW
jgi:opacity protein-like surface antigen